MYRCWYCGLTSYGVLRPDQLIYCPHCWAYKREIVLGPIHLIQTQKDCVAEKLNPKDAAARTRIPLSLLPPIGQITQALAHLNGAEKYNPYNWRESAISYMEYLAAMQRHIACLIDHEDTDFESKVHHLGHIMATAAIILDAQHYNKLIDDRPGSVDFVHRASATFRGHERSRKGMTEMWEASKDKPKEETNGK